MQFIKKIVVWLLILESRLILAKYKPFIVAVTGSVGKTSTKDAIYCVLKDHGKLVRKSDKSMNSDIGLPLTVIGAPNAWRSPSGWIRNLREGLSLILSKKEYPDCLVLELGADHPGDIRSIARWLRPDIAVITRVSRTPVHVEFFASPEQVFEEKASLAEAVKDGGTVVLFSDDDKVMSIADRVKGRNVSVISFGTSSASNIRGTDEKVVYEGAPVGISFTVTIDATSSPVAVRGVLGQTYMYPPLAAAAVGKARGMSAADIIQGLNGYRAPRGRMNLIPGKNGSTLIDDTYNSSPDAVAAALQALKGLECLGASPCRRIAVLGDMMELGKYSADEHRSIGWQAAGAVDLLITVGPRSTVTADEAVKSGMSADKALSFSTAGEAVDALLPIVRTGDLILIKGSQSVRMEKAVKALMAEPEKADELLVRQEAEWLEKK